MDSENSSVLYLHTIPVRGQILTGNTANSVMFQLSKDGVYCALSYQLLHGTFLLIISSVIS